MDPQAEGYYADPENCRWFFACLDHARDGLTPPTAYEFRCPFGLVFDESRQLCNWPWLVEGCGNAGGSLLYQGVRLTAAGAAGAAGAAEGPNYEGLSLLSAGIGGGAAGGTRGEGAYVLGAGAGAYKTADASYQSASLAGGAAAAGSGGYVYDKPSTSFAAEINNNLASAGRYGDGNGYIALSEAGGAAGASRYEDRGYGGFATFPATQVSGGRTEGSSGVILGANLHGLQGLQGVQGVQTGFAYQAGASGAQGFGK